MNFNLGDAVEQANQQYFQQRHSERHQRAAELYEKMVSSGIFTDDELATAKFEFGL